MKSLKFGAIFVFVAITQTTFSQDTTKYFKIVKGSVVVNRDETANIFADYDIVINDNDFITVSKYSVKVYRQDKSSFNILTNWKKRLSPNWNDYESEVVDEDDVRCNLQLIDEYSSTPKNSWELIIRYKTYSLTFQLIRDPSKE